MAFNPDINAKINPSPVKGTGGNVGMDWNMANIAREGEAFEKFGKTLDSVGKGMMEYAKKWKDDEIKSDILAVNSLRNNLWADAQNEFDADPTINTEEKARAFWEKKDREIDETIRKEYKANARWFDDSIRFVEAENKEASAKSFVNMNGALIRRNRQRNESICNGLQENCFNNPNDMSAIEQVKGMMRRLGYTDEQINLFDKSIEGARFTQDLKKQEESISLLPTSKEQINAYKKLYKEINSDYYKNVSEVYRNQASVDVAKRIGQLERGEKLAYYEAGLAYSVSMCDGEELKFSLEQWKSVISEDKSLDDDKRNALLVKVNEIEKKVEVGFLGKEISNSYSLITSNKTATAEYTENILKGFQERVDNIKDPQMMAQLQTQLDTTRNKIYNKQKEDLRKAIKEIEQAEKETFELCLGNSLKTNNFNLSAFNIPDGGRVPKELKHEYSYALRKEMNRLAITGGSVKAYTTIAVEIQRQFGDDDDTRRMLFTELNDVYNGKKESISYSQENRAMIASTIAKQSHIDGWFGGGDKLHKWDKLKKEEKSELLQGGFGGLVLNVIDTLKDGGYTFAEFQANRSKFPQINAMIDDFKSKKLIDRSFEDVNKTLRHSPHYTKTKDDFESTGGTNTSTQNVLEVQKEEKQLKEKVGQ